MSSHSAPISIVSSTFQTPNSITPSESASQQPHQSAGLPNTPPPRVPVEVGSGGGKPVDDRADAEPAGKGPDNSVVGSQSFVIYDQNDPEEPSLEDEEAWWSPTQKFPASSYDEEYGHPSDQFWGSNMLTDEQFLDLKRRQMALHERELKVREKEHELEVLKQKGVLQVTPVHPATPVAPLASLNPIPPNPASPGAPLAPLVWREGGVDPQQGSPAAEASPAAAPVVREVVQHTVVKPDDSASIVTPNFQTLTPNCWLREARC